MFVLIILGQKCTLAALCVDPNEQRIPIHDSNQFADSLHVNWFESTRFPKKSAAMLAQYMLSCVCPFVCLS